jgi:hypothetical protein
VTEAVSNLVILHNNCKVVLVKRVFTHARTTHARPINHKSSSKPFSLCNHRQRRVFER